MSVKSKLLASAAALTLAGGVAVVATSGTAHAETPSCGPTCVDLFNVGPGSTYGAPSFLLDSYKQEQATGSPVILFATSNTDPAQDWQVGTPDTVSDYLQAGLVGVNVALHYGCVPGVDFSQCTGSGGVGVDLYAFELEYSPFGAPTGECAGVAATATAGEHVTLQPCGVSGKTLWLWDSPCYAVVTAPSGVTTQSPGCPQTFPSWESFLASNTFPLINGSDTNFSQPFVLTYPSGASPLSAPRPQLETENLTTFANPFPGTDVADSQLWGAHVGETLP